MIFKKIMPRSAAGRCIMPKRGIKATAQPLSVGASPVTLHESWSGRPDLNGRPLAPHASALPGCATPRSWEI